MWISILTFVGRTDSDGVLRVFTVSSSGKSITQKLATEYHVRGLRDPEKFDKYFDERLGQHFECELGSNKSGNLFWAMPYSKGEHKFECVNCSEEQVTPNESDWAAFAATVMEYWEKESDEVGKHHRWIEGLQLELKQEIDRNVRKAAFFQNTNQERRAEMMGRLEAQRLIQAWLK